MPKSSLFIVTCTGGTVGRSEDLGHSIVIPDPSVSKVCYSYIAFYEFVINIGDVINFLTGRSSGL